VRFITLRPLAILAVSLLLVGVSEAKRPIPGSLPPGAKLYISGMEWNLNACIAAEIRRQGLSLQLVEQPEDADFVMTGFYQGLGSHLLAAGHYIQIKIVAADGGKEVWFAEANDYAVFFGRLRPHGSRKAAAEIVKKLRNFISG
jgi:hypothetical protein